MQRFTFATALTALTAAFNAGCSSAAPVTTPTPAPVASAPSRTATTAAERPPACSGPAVDGRVFTSDEIDLPPAYRDGPAVRYPAALRQAGVSGRVTLSYIVNGDGSVDSASVAVVSSTNPAFEAPSRIVVAATRFWPGCLRGQPVRTRIQQGIMFDVKRDGGGAP